MDELKKLFRRSKSKNRKSSSSGLRSDYDNSQQSSPARPAPQRQRSNTLPTNIPPVNTNYNNVPEGRVSETSPSSLHARKASVPDLSRSTVRKPVGSATDDQSTARSETRLSSAPVSNSAPYGTAGYSGAQVAPAQAYGSPAGNYNNNCGYIFPS